MCFDSWKLGPALRNEIQANSERIKVVSRSDLASVGTPEMARPRVETTPSCGADSTRFPGSSRLDSVTPRLKTLCARGNRPQNWIHVGSEQAGPPGGRHYRDR